MKLLLLRKYIKNIFTGKQVNTWILDLNFPIIFSFYGHCEQTCKEAMNVPTKISRKTAAA